MRKVVNIVRKRFDCEWAWRLFVVLSVVVPVWTISLSVDDDSEWALLPSIWIESYSSVSRILLQAEAATKCEDSLSKVPDWLKDISYRDCVHVELARLEDLEKDRGTTLRVEWNMVFVGLIYDDNAREFALLDHIVFCPILLGLIIIHVITPFVVIPFLTAKALDYLAGGFSDVR